MTLEACNEYMEHVGAKRALAVAMNEQLARRERELFAAPGGLLKFVKHFWHVLEPETPFQDGWPLKAMAEHLEAVADGRITRLLINISPGSMKSLLCSVFFPAWLWGAKDRPAARFLCLSYSEALPQRDNRKTINLINSPAYQRLYGKRVKLVKSGEELLETSATGSKQAAGLTGSVTGRRADICILDDPNNVADIESDAIREKAARIFQEAASNRLNDMTRSAIIVIQQRSHQDDISGIILEGGLPYIHLCIPLLYEPSRHCETEIGWSDPREEDRECFWPERFPDEAIQAAMDLGEFAFAGQYQQRPAPRGGGILRYEYWKCWNPVPNKITGKRDFPVCDFVLASLDPAYTAKQENDPSGFTIWGTFQTEKGERGAILLDAFSKRLELCGPDQPRYLGETDADYRARAQERWGLVETVADRCKRFKVDVLLIENKASGLSVVQAMARLFPRSRFQVQTYDPKGLDKTARVNMVQPVFSGGYIWAPYNVEEPLDPGNKEWARMVIDECAVFPRGRHDDLVDSTSSAINYLRSNGFLDRREEQFISKDEAKRQYKAQPALYNI